MKVSAATSLESMHLSKAEEFDIFSTICEWERIEYGEGKHRVPYILQACAQKNRSGFFVLCESGSLQAYADVWELSPDFYSGLSSGLIDEESLSADYILGRFQARTSLWYIGSIITNPARRAERPTASAIAFAAICNALPNFFRGHSEFPARVLGVGSSPFGKKLLSRWGFEPVVPAIGAIDLRPRFEKRMVMPSDADSLSLGIRKSGSSEIGVKSYEIAKSGSEIGVKS